MPSPHLIVWDLDGTLGNFEPMTQVVDNGQEIEVQTRPGIVDALTTLSDAGFIHVVLTLATSLYAEIVLTGCGLRGHFQSVEGRGQRGKGDVEGLAQRFEIPESERAARMIFIGDNPIMDAPRDRQILFHFEAFALSRSASELARLILLLRERGEGSLRLGFEGLMQSGEIETVSSSAHARVQRCAVPELRPLLVALSAEHPPLIAFEHPPEPAAAPGRHRFAPGQIARGLTR